MDSPSTWRSTLRGISREAILGTFMRICWPRLARCPAKVWEGKRRSISVTRVGGSSGWDRPSGNCCTCGSAGRRWRTWHSSRRTSMRGSTIAVSRRRASLASPSYGFRASRTRSSGAAAAASSPNEFARITVRASSRNARVPDSSGLERDRHRARSEDIARQAVENWLRYRRDRKLERGEARAGREVGAYQRERSSRVRPAPPGSRRANAYRSRP